MKKSIIIAALGVASAAASYGQGQINFSNYVTSSQSTGVTYGNGPAMGLGVGPEISAELFYGASTDTLVTELTGLASSITAFGINGSTGPAALPPVGAFASSGVFEGPSPTVPGTAGSVYAFAIYAFGTYQSLTYTGWSSIFTGATQGSVSPLPTVPNLPTGLINDSFTVTSIPEPCTLALAGLGGFGMLMALRRKQA